MKSPRSSRLPDPAAILRREALEEVRAIYRELENRPVERNCLRRTECCQFKLTGRTPQLTKGEALLAARAVRAAGRKEMPERTDGACPLLRENGACLIYQDRPFGCRTHFCAAAGGPYARSEVVDLIRRLEAIDTRLSGDGPRALPVAVRDELRLMERGG
ncbi:MAG: YkgJ family cysteine cluster protein [Methylacidiphilales bacterium]|nr:YkgJ family cysteine cluster protein [Candidatus Methylacidiphilales bacterium]